MPDYLDQRDGLARIDDVHVRRIIRPNGTLDAGVFEFVLKSLGTVVRKRSAPAPPVAAPAHALHVTNATEIIDKLPLSVDVDVQSNFTEVFDIAASTGTLCPLIVMAPETERVEAFIDAHLRFHIPKLQIGFRRLGDEADGITNLYVNHVSNSNDMQFAKTMAQGLRMMLLKDLPDLRRGIVSTSDDLDDCLSALAAGFQELATPGKPLVCVNAPFAIRSMQSEHCATVDAWLRLWHRVGKRMTGVGFVPILPVVMAGHPAGWQKGKNQAAGCYPHGWWNPFRECRNGLFHAHIRTMKAEQDVHLAGVLPPVEESRAINWAGTIDRTVLPLVEKAFASRRARKRGLTMTDFRDSIISG